MKRCILLALAVSLLLGGCGLIPGGEVPLTQTDGTEQTVQTGENGEAEYVPLDEELDAARGVKLEPGEEARALADFAAAMETMRDQGLDFLSYGMTRQAAWCFSFVGGSVSAVRYAAELLLEQTPTGFSGWDTIGAISYCTPVPLMCEAIVSEFFGDTERAEECRDMVSSNPFVGEETDGLSVLTELSDSGLKELVDGLIAFEKHIYWFYPADPQPEERFGYEWSAEFHLDSAALFDAMGQQELATRCYMDALAADPFDPDVFATCAVAMYSRSNVDLMRTYIEDGLLMDPSHGTLNVLAALYWSGAGEEEKARSHLDIADGAELTEEDMVIYDAVVAFIGEV